MNKHILYVEDDLDSCELIQVWLGFHGYEVQSVHRAVEAALLAKASSYSLFILDNWLPDGDGVELCKQIHAGDSAAAIIFLSGAAYPHDIDQALTAGAQAYFTKPVDLSELLCTVSQLVGGQDKETLASVARAKQ